MPKTRLEFKDHTSSKFWEVEVSGALLTVTYGKIGTAGQTKAKECADPAAADSERGRLLTEKTKKGYVVVGGSSSADLSSAPGARPKAKPKQASQQNIARRIEERFGIAVPARYLEFIESDEYLKHQGKFAVDLIGYAKDVKLKVRFDHKSLVDLFQENDISQSEVPELIPFAQLESEPQFFVIDISAPECAVSLWEHETGAFNPYAESLDKFLGALVTEQEFKSRLNEEKKVLTSIKKHAKRALPKAEKLYASGKPGEARVLLDEFLQDQKAIRYDGDNDFEAVGYLCASLYLRSRCELAEGRYEAAFESTVAAASCGGEKVGTYSVDYETRLIECCCIALPYLPISSETRLPPKLESRART